MIEDFVDGQDHHFRIVVKNDNGVWVTFKDNVIPSAVLPLYHEAEKSFPRGAYSHIRIMKITPTEETDVTVRVGMALYWEEHVIEQAVSRRLDREERGEPEPSILEGVLKFPGIKQ